MKKDKLENIIVATIMIITLIIAIVIKSKLGISSKLIFYTLTAIEVGIYCLFKKIL